MTNWISISKETFTQKLESFGEGSSLDSDYNSRDKSFTYYINNEPVLQKVKYYNNYGYYKNTLADKDL